MATIYKSQQGKKEVINFYEKILNEGSEIFKKRYVQTNFGKTFVLSCGISSQPPIILLHGAGSNSAMWMEDLKQLSENYHVFAIDIIGECNKSSENRYPYRDKVYSQWLHEVIVELDIDNPVLVGCSLGGWIVLDYIISYPNEVSKLVLISSAGLVNIKLSMIFWVLITSLLGESGFKKINEKVYGNLKIDTRILQFASLVRQHYIPRTDLLPLIKDEDLKKIKRPVLYFGGKDDCFYKSKMAARRLKKHLPQSECHILKDRGHVLINLTCDILNFLECN